MGQCVFCNQSAGFLRRSHAECKARHESGKRQIVELVGDIRSEDRDLDQLEARVAETAAGSFVDDIMLRDLVVSGWESAVDVVFEDTVISEKEEQLLEELKDHFDLSDAALDRNGALSMTHKGKVIRELMEGNLPEHTTAVGAPALQPAKDRTAGLGIPGRKILRTQKANGVRRWFPRSERARRPGRILPNGIFQGTQSRDHGTGPRG